MFESSSAEPLKGKELSLGHYEEKKVFGARQEKEQDLFKKSVCDVLDAIEWSGEMSG